MAGVVPPMNWKKLKLKQALDAQNAKKSPTTIQQPPPDQSKNASAWAAMMNAEKAKLDGLVGSDDNTDESMDELSEADWCIAELHKEVDLLKKQLVTIHKEAHDAKETGNTYKNKMVAMAEALAQSRRELAETHGKAQQTTESLQTCRTEMKWMKNELDNSRRELGDANDKAQQATESLGWCREELGLVKNELDELRRELGIVNDKGSQAQESLDKCKAELETVSNMLATKQQQLDKEQTKVEFLKRTSGKQEQDYIVAKAQVQKVEMTLHAREEEIEGMRDIVNKLRVDLVQAQLKSPNSKPAGTTDVLQVAAEASSSTIVDCNAALRFHLHTRAQQGLNETVPSLQRDEQYTTVSELIAAHYSNM